MSKKVGDWIDLCNSEDVSINTFECKPIFIPKGSRICQFRIMPKMEKVKFVETFRMLDKDRGGYGSTGV